MVAADLRYAWAAYRAGAFPRVQEGLTKENFWPQIARWVEATRPGAAFASLTDRGGHVLGWLIAWRFALGSAHAIEYRVVWSPWASARFRLESVIAFLARTRGQAKAIWACEGAESRLYEHACRYGVARTMCHSHGFFGPGRDAKLFESVEIR